jgi:hypothetical protein
MDEIKIDYKRAREISFQAMSMFREGVYPFKRDERGYYISGSKESLFPDVVVPESIERGSKEHSLLLFYGCGIDSMKLADQVYKGVRGLASEVSFQDLHTLDKLKLAELLSRHFEPSILRKFQAGEPIMGDPVRTLYENSRKLHLDYQDDPRKLVCATIPATREAIEDFFQYGEGKSALLIKNFNRFGISDFPEPELPVKVDRHIKRISIGCRVVRLSKGTTLTRGRGDKLVRRLEEVYQRVTRTEGISGIELDDAFWAIGRYLCKFNDDVRCKTSCKIDCPSRPNSDNGAIFFDFGSEKRENTYNLFRWARENKATSS